MMETFKFQYEKRYVQCEYLIVYCAGQNEHARKKLSLLSMVIEPITASLHVSTMKSLGQKKSSSLVYLSCMLTIFIL